LTLGCHALFCVFIDLPIEMSIVAISNAESLTAKHFAKQFTIFRSRIAPEL